jgi:hypothetical protein
MLLKIPVLDKDSKVAASFVWDGNLYEGEYWFENNDATPKQALDATEIIDAHRYLRGVRFVSVGARHTVPGWTGVEGMLGALRLSLPAVGLRVGQYDRTGILPGAADLNDEDKPTDLPGRIW